jgi:hypothetical protein
VRRHLVIAALGVLLHRVMFGVCVVVFVNGVAAGLGLVRLDVVDLFRGLAVTAAHVRCYVIHYMIHAILSGHP